MNLTKSMQIDAQDFKESTVTVFVQKYIYFTIHP